MLTIHNIDKIVFHNIAETGHYVKRVTPYVVVDSGTNEHTYWYHMELVLNGEITLLRLNRVLNTIHTGYALHKGKRIIYITIEELSTLKEILKAIGYLMSTK